MTQHPKKSLLKQTHGRYGHHREQYNDVTSPSHTNGHLTMMKHSGSENKKVRQFKLVYNIRDSIAYKIIYIFVYFVITSYFCHFLPNFV